MNETQNALAALQAELAARRAVLASRRSARRAERQAENTIPSVPEVTTFELDPAEMLSLFGVLA